MSSFKPKLYRSQEGCCICKAKSSSSRFTDSKKYEGDCRGCFKLERSRSGEICNACVLIVKRWKKLPAHTTKDWAHVVDARTGPGIKNVFKHKKKEVSGLDCTPDKYKHKHVYRRKRKNKPKKSEDTEMLNSADTENIPDFIDPSYWQRERVCCGLVWTGQLGEVMVEQQHYKPCQASQHSRNTSEPSCIETLAEEELLSLPSEQCENEEFYTNNNKIVQKQANNNESENVNCFYDKIDPSPMDILSQVSLIASH